MAPFQDKASFSCTCVLCQSSVIMEQYAVISGSLHMRTSLGAFLKVHCGLVLQADCRRIVWPAGLLFGPCVWCGACLCCRAQGCLCCRAQAEPQFCSTGAYRWVPRGPGKMSLRPSTTTSRAPSGTVGREGVCESPKLGVEHP